MHKPASIATEYILALYILIVLLHLYQSNENNKQSNKLLDCYTIFITHIYLYITHNTRMIRSIY